MIDEPEPQLTLTENHSALIASEARISLLARGRSDAALLVQEVPGWQLRQIPLWQVRQQASAGFSNAQHELGDRYREGRSVAKDPAAAAAWYLKAADQGHLYALCSLGEMYQAGEGVTQSLSEAIRCFCTANDDDFTEGWDPDCVVMMWLRAAELGDPEAQSRCGTWRRHQAKSCSHGDRQRQDYLEEAARWDRKAAEQGHLYAQLAVGSLYATGEGVPQDYTEAASWYRKAAEQGHIIGDKLPRRLHELFPAQRLLDVRKAV